MVYLCKVFQSSSGRKYLYDAVTNNIVRISDALYYSSEKLLGQQFEEADASALEMQGYKYLKERLIDTEYIMPYKAETADYPYNIQGYLEALENSIAHINLGITEECNMRCRYCCFSGHYKTMRSHSGKHMSFETAKRAVDFYYKHSGRCKLAIIGFYGGEPLLEFDLIKDIVDYSRNLFKDKPMYYHITTNGTLINDEIIDWLGSNKDVYINITLNGDSDFHNQYRVYRDGSATHRDILSNIMKLKELYPQFYKDNINFLCNYAALPDLKKLSEYFNNNNKNVMLEGKQPILINGVSSANGDKYIEAITDDDICEEEGQEIYKMLCEEYVYSDKSSYSFVNALFDKSLSKIHLRDNAQLKETAYITGNCIPFISRIFVDYKGRFNVCEKICNLGELGDVNTGINTDRILRLMDDYKNALKKECIGCWAQRFCSICFNDVLSEGGALEDIKQRKEGCEINRRGVVETLSLYCDVLEKSPDKTEIFEAFELPVIYEDK